MHMENPGALLFLLPAIAAYAIGMVRVRALSRHFPVGIRVRIGFMCRIAAFALLVPAAAKISWGTQAVLSPGSGQAVSFVFDISHSMTAEDAMPYNPSGENLTRLQAARVFAQGLLTRLDPGTPVSVVTAKGDGIVSVPLTNDTAQITSMLNALSPYLMSAPGSSIGRGIAAASLTFPQDYTFKPAIIVFTDGDETDNTLQSAAADAVRSGISVYFVGFGSETGTQVIAGDGVTEIGTSLKKEKLVRAAEEASAVSALKHYPEMPFAESLFFEASAKGSAVRLLDALHAESEANVKAEIKPVSRYAGFLTAALLMFIAGILIEQLNVQKTALLIGSHKGTSAGQQSRAHPEISAGQQRRAGHQSAADESSRFGTGTGPGNGNDFDTDSGNGNTNITGNSNSRQNTPGAKP